MTNIGCANIISENKISYVKKKISSINRLLRLVTMNQKAVNSQKFPRIGRPSTDI